MIKHDAITIALMVGMSVGVANAGQFRNFSPIKTPAQAEAQENKPNEQAVALAQPKAVDREMIEKGVGELLAGWSNGDADQLLDEQFYDRDRLSDNISLEVPDDASIRLLGVLGSQVLEQYQYQEDGEQIISSVVSVTANTQIEFNDPELGFRRLNGQNEYILRVEEVVVETP